jgi:hypothetical protein
MGAVFNCRMRACDGCFVPDCTGARSISGFGSESSDADDGSLHARRPASAEIRRSVGSSPNRFATTHGFAYSRSFDSRAKPLHDDGPHTCQFLLRLRVAAVARRILVANPAVFLIDIPDKREL